MGAALRAVLAPNASPMTLDGTRTWIVGTRVAAVIDPGSAAPAHLDRLAHEVAGATVSIVVTHEHPDHSTGAAELAARLGAPILGIAAGSLQSGDAVPTDAGDLVAIPTPGHAPDHIALHWPSEQAVFVGDLMMGGLDTAVVAAPEGDLGQYIESLERIRTLRPRILYPAHGPPFEDPDEAIDRYIRHREERRAQVLDAVRAGARTPEEIVTRVYGESLDPKLRYFAERAVEAYLMHLRRHHELDG